MANKKKPSTGVFDIAKPGRSGLATSATTKPVIISNRPVMQDPMMVSDAPKDTEPSTAPVLKPTKKVVIKPLHDDIEPDAAAEPAPIVQTPQLVTADIITPIVKKPELPEPEEDEPEAPAEKVTAPVAALSADEQSEADAQKAAARVSRLEKLIEDEQYFLPINTVEERRSRRLAILGAILIIVLSLAWYDSALDAGLVPNTYNLPHTSFFSVK
jgi:hypothetical protein